MNDDVISILAFQRSMLERLSSRVEPFAWGRAFLDERFPKRWDSNFLWVEAPLDRVAAEDLVAEADRVLGGAGLAHRRIYLDDDDEGARLRPGFEALGWTAERLLWMAARREPEREGGGVAEEVDLATIRPALEEINRRQPWGSEDPEAVRMLVDYRGHLAATIGARFFVVREAGAIASTCELYAVDGVAQVEDVNTLEEFRGRGYARAVVLGALRAAADAGCDLRFLIADEDDWPKHLYASIGFDPILRSWVVGHAPAAVTA
jgi:GNAT superfamily N-acetyltransferase